MNNDKEREAFNDYIRKEEARRSRQGQVQRVGLWWWWLLAAMLAAAAYIGWMWR